jgi:hypothetical protein
MFQTKVVEKIKTHILCSITFFLKSCCLWDNVEKYVTARQATDDNIIRRMRFECWITKATDTHSENVTLFFHGKNGYVNAPQYYVTRKLPDLSNTKTPVPYIYIYISLTTSWRLLADLYHLIHIFVSATNIGNSRRLLPVRDTPAYISVGRRNILTKNVGFLQSLQMSE